MDGNLAALRQHEARQERLAAEDKVIQRIAAERQDDPDYQIDALCYVTNDYMHLVRDLVYGNSDEVDAAQHELRRHADAHIANEATAERDKILADEESAAADAEYDYRREDAA